MRGAARVRREAEVGAGQRPVLHDYELRVLAALVRLVYAHLERDPCAQEAATKRLDHYRPARDRPAPLAERASLSAAPHRHLCARRREHLELPDSRTSWGGAPGHAHDRERSHEDRM